MTTLVAVNAGLGNPSTTRLLADRIAHEALRQFGDSLEIINIDIREHARAISEAMLSGTTSGELRDAIEAVTEADALIVATPVYNASFSGLFKSFFDVIEPGRLVGMPVLLAANGGTHRHTLVTEQAMRPMFSYVRAVTAPTAVFATGSDLESDSQLADRISRAVSELRSLTMSGIRATATDGSHSFMSFDDLENQSR